MLNFKLSTILLSLAEMSKSKEGGSVAVMDFTRAARTIRDYSGDIEKAYDNGTIQKLPGINAQVYSFLRQYFETGKIGLYEDLKAVYSEDLINFVRMSGLGKKRVFKIYGILGLKSAADLKNAIEDRSIFERVLNNPGLESGFITPGNIERLIFSFDYFEKTKKLFPKAYAGFFIDKVINSILNLKDVKKVQITGSFRRKKPFINDIDLLVLPVFNSEQYNISRSEQLLKGLVQLDFIKKLVGIDYRDESTLARSNTINNTMYNTQNDIRNDIRYNALCSARFKTIYDIDIEIILSSRTGWAFDLFNTTGSKTHIAEIKKLARQKGLNLSGIKSVDTAKGDITIYEKLGIEYTEPELRENTGEVKLAQNFSLPDLIKPADIKGDLHVHSYWSDGLIEMDDLLEKCRQHNYEYLAITDHSASNKYGNGLDETRIFEKIQHFKDFKKHIKDIKLLVGGEVDIRSIGNFDYDDDILKQIDFVLASMHSNYLNSRIENTQRVTSAIKNRFVDGIAHPTGVVFGARAPYDLDMGQIFEDAARFGKTLEINSYLLRLDLNEGYVRQFKKLGGRVVINTDSHRLDNLDMIKFGVEIARRAGVEKKDVINAMSLKELLNWKSNRTKLFYSS